MPVRSASRRIAAFALTASILAMTPALPASKTPSEAVAPTEARAFADRIAERYGLAEFPQVTSLRFSFHSRQEGEDVMREWTWFPQVDSVSFRGKDPKGLEVTATYSRRNKYSLSSETVAGIDQEFIHDQYWLLFPLHLAWDKEIELKLGTGGKLTVRYPRAGGYSSGDIYDLIAEPDGTIRSWTVRRGGGDSVTQRADWSKPTQVGSLPISLDRPGQKGFKIRFSDVRVVGIVTRSRAPLPVR